MVECFDDFSVTLLLVVDQLAKDLYHKVLVFNLGVELLDELGAFVLLAHVFELGVFLFQDLDRVHEIADLVLLDLDEGSEFF